MRSRQGFTLVELLVATALVLFVMVILTQAFTAGLGAFRELKGLGDMEERLRSTSTILRRDLAADHFEARRRLSDPNFWQLGPPREGYVRIQQGAASVLEGTDGDGLPSWYATNHALAFTVKLRGNNRGDFFSALIQDPGPPLGGVLPTLGQTDGRYQDVARTYNSQWAEVVYFMVANGTTAGGTPLFALYRRQRVAVPPPYNDQLNWVISAGPPPTPVALTSLPYYNEVSCEANPNAAYANYIYFNSPIDLTVQQRRFGMPATAGTAVLAGTYTPLGTGDDLLLTDVVSFDVQVLSPDLSITNDFTDLPAATPIFDTWSTVYDDTYNYSTTPAPLPIRINAVQIILRVWDLKTQQTRQITIVQDM